MKTLTLLRHAKSGWDDPTLRDFDRALNAKGRRGAATVARELKRLGVSFDHVVASPAVRVVETIEEVEASFGSALAPVWDRRVYLASWPTLLDVIHELPEGASSAMLAGHNPGLEELALALVPDTAGDQQRDAVETKFPTASIAVIEFDVARWVDVAKGGGRLVRFLRPRDLDPSLGPDDSGY